MAMSEEAFDNVATYVAALDLGDADSTNKEVDASGVDVSTGEVAVKKGSGKVKVRKGQSSEAFAEQLRQFRSEGPTVNDIDWLKRITIEDVKDATDKVSVGKYIHLLELLYYERDYSLCLQRCDDFIEKFSTKEMVEQLKDAGLLKGKKKDKNMLVVKEVLDIKDHCLKKLSL